MDVPGDRWFLINMDDISSRAFILNKDNLSRLQNEYGVSEIVVGPEIPMSDIYTLRDALLSTTITCRIVVVNELFV